MFSSRAGGRFDGGGPSTTGLLGLTLHDPERTLPTCIVGLRGSPARCIGRSTRPNAGAHMRKILAAGIGVLALAAAMQPAAAADLPVKAPVYKAPPVYIDPWTWTGVYIGLNAGYSWGRSRTHVDYFNSLTGLPIAPPAGSITDVDFNLNGGIAGGQIGYNWQASNWVGGIEADIQWSGQKGSADFFCARNPVGAPGPCLPTLTGTLPGTTGTTLLLDQRLRWFGTLRGRLGVLFAPTVLAYVTGGLAYGEIKTEGTLNGFDGNQV